MECDKAAIDKQQSLILATKEKIFVVCTVSIRVLIIVFNQSDFCLMLMFCKIVNLRILSSSCKRQPAL